MDELLKNFSSLSWWVSVGVVTVLLNLLSTLLLRKLDGAGLFISRWRRNRSERKKELFELYVSYLVANPERLASAYANEMRWRSRAIFLLALGSTSGLALFVFAQPYGTAFRGILILLLAILALLAMQLDGRADRAGDAATEAERRLDGESSPSSAALGGR